MRTLSLFTLAALAAVPALGAQSGYAAGTHRYKLTQSVKQNVNAQQVDVSSLQQVTIALAPKAKDTLQMTLTVDSATINSNVPAAAPDISKLMHASTIVLLSTNGQYYSATKDTTADQVVQQLLDQLGRMLPTLPRTLKAGSSLTDTVSVTRNQGGLLATSTIISTAKVVGDTMYNGEKAWRVARTSMTKLSGTGEMQGSPVTMDGKGDGSGTTYVSTKGVFLGSSGSNNISFTLTFPSNGMSVPVTQNVTSSVTEIK
jgi:hypothetical protein